MRIKIKDLPVGECFLQGRAIRKKVSETKASTVKPNHRVSTRKVKSGLEVEQVSCPLELLGVGLRRHPDQVVEIGDGNLQKGKKRTT